MPLNDINIPIMPKNINALDNLNIPIVHKKINIYDRHYI
jgi:hypothetical protein